MKIFINTIIDDLLKFHESNVSFGYKERIKLERNLFLLLSEFLELEFNYQLNGFTNYYKQEILKLINKESNTIHNMLVVKIFETKFTIQRLSSDNAYLRNDTLSKIGLRTQNQIYKLIAIQIVNINNYLNKLKIIDIPIDRNSIIELFNHYKTFFLSIAIPSEIQQEIHLYQSDISQMYHAKWVDREKLHITLLFLGKVNLNYVEDIQYLIRRIIESFKKIELCSEKIELIKTKNDKLIWLTIEDNQDLNELFSKLKSGLRKYIQNVSDVYKPHITLSYNCISEKKLLTVKELSCRFNVFEIQLIEKQYNKEGSNIFVWDSFKLS